MFPTSPAYGVAAELTQSVLALVDGAHALHASGIVRIQREWFCGPIPPTVQHCWQPLWSWSGCRRQPGAV